MNNKPSEETLNKPIEQATEQELEQVVDYIVSEAQGIIDNNEEWKQNTKC